MTRDEALLVFKKEMERLASIAVLGKYCSDATYGADRTMGEWLKFMCPLYQIKMAREHNADDKLILEMWPNIQNLAQKAQDYEDRK